MASIVSPILLSACQVSPNEESFKDFRRSRRTLSLGGAESVSTDTDSPEQERIGGSDQVNPC
jgi:hypothetical protein